MIQNSRVDPKRRKVAGNNKWSNPILVEVVVVLEDDKRRQAVSASGGRNQLFFRKPKPVTAPTAARSLQHDLLKCAQYNLGIIKSRAVRSIVT